MSEHFKRVMTKKSDQELIEIATNHSGYSSDALKAVLEQFQVRGINHSTYEELSKHLSLHEKVIKQKSERFKIPDNLHPNIKIASNLIFLTIPVGLVNLLVLRSIDDQILSNTKDIISAILTWIFVFLIGYWVRMGSKNSRLVLTILSAFGLVFTIPNLLIFFQLGFIPGTINLVLTIISVLAVILLYLKGTSNWYRELKTKDNNG